MEKKRRILNYNLKRVASEGLQGFKDIFILNKKNFSLINFLKINLEYNPLFKYDWIFSKYS